jgi:hypothetical protein
LKTVFCHVARSMRAVAVSERTRLGSRSKVRRSVLRRRLCCITAGALHGRTRQMKGKL